jgi:hypothetical protein
MDLRELVDLITVRQYVVNSTANATIDRATVTVMNNMLIMIDKKILSLIQSSEFKAYVNYGDVRKAVEEVANINNIKSGLHRNPNTGQLEKIQK